MEALTATSGAGGGSGAAAPRGRPAQAMAGKLVRSFLCMALVGLLGACAPGAFGPGAATDPVATELERTAQVLYHRMELGRLETGVYTTNALIDVKLPEGARWTLQEFATDGSSYVLVLRSSRLPSTAWRVSPRGVSRFAPG